ncbi:MAG: peroxidase family protein, partial [Myxococcota bacterium]|nr:peroxidase family protein [Myxococcota bacterium]
PFVPGRTDASQKMTDTTSFANLEPQADGFRNYMGPEAMNPAPEMLVEKADLLTLSAPEMSVLVAGLRVLGANYGNSSHGVLTDRVGTLSNDFFVNLLDMGLEWKKGKEGVYEAVERQSGEVKWTGTTVDLVFGSNSQLRAISEVYASSDASEKFAQDFAAVWAKVMSLDRFDLVAKARIAKK